MLFLASLFSFKFGIRKRLLYPLLFAILIKAINNSKFVNFSSNPFFLKIIGLNLSSLKYFFPFLLKEEDYQNHFLKINKKGKKYFKDDKFNPIILRKKGLEEKLTNLELLMALINIAKRRGYSNRFLIPNLNENKDARKSIEKSKELIKKYKYPIKAITEDPFFNFNPKDLSKFNYRSRVFNESKFNEQIFLDKNKKEIN